MRATFYKRHIFIWDCGAYRLYHAENRWQGIDEMQRMREIRVMLTRLSFGVLLVIMASASAFAAENVIFMRHALAPGVGDPASFSIDDCNTQRNLNDEGRKQAKEIGRKFRDNDILVTRVLSSPWCRCVDTAEELGLGDWEVHDGLASFFEGHVDRDETITALLSELAGIRDDESWLLVTHQVVIQAVTGIFVPSGGLVIYDPETRQSRLFTLR